MYLHRICAENFRAFGDGKNAPKLDWELNRGMNILIGENDAGKTAIIDAIRLILLTTSFETFRLFEQDFHVDRSSRATNLSIEATLKGLSVDQEAGTLEWLTYNPDGTCDLILNLQAKLRPLSAKQRSRVDVLVRAGHNGVGPEVGGAVRELVRATYLRPLRDAEAELRPGRFSRLSQILNAHQTISQQKANDFDPKNPGTMPTTLVGLMAYAQHHIGQHQVVKSVETDINGSYLNEMCLEGDCLESRIQISSDLSLRSILERFELALLPPNGIPATEPCSRGLGYNNALFMASELVLLKEGAELALLLVEEPEAHLHPQLQGRVMALLDGYTRDDKPAVQVVMTTHSPTLAAGAEIQAMTLVYRARTFRLRPEDTRLATDDYEFLRRFIDATKANLFFARGVAVVEGPAEALLLPAIAEMVGLSFSKHGVSMVNVGGVGLYHYARVFQRQSGEQIGVPVACITDRDIVPDAAAEYVTKPKKGKRFAKDYGPSEVGKLIERKRARVEDEGNPNVKVFVSDHWTLEYDLAREGLAELVFEATLLASQDDSNDESRKDSRDGPCEGSAIKTSSVPSHDAAWAEYRSRHTTTEALAVAVYQPLYEKDVSKATVAQHAAKLLRSGKYGSGTTLLQKVPPYIRLALRHLTGAAAPVNASSGEPV